VILLVGLIIVVATVPLTGGRFSALAEIRWRRGNVALAALLAQIVVLGPAATALPHGAVGALHVATFVLAFVFVISNRHVQGLWIVAAGGFTNLLAIAANGGVMPASLSALATAGLAPRASEPFRNSTLVRHPDLAFLGDVFAIPKGWPLANVFSIGDVLLVVGAAVVVHTAARSRCRGVEALHSGHH
jgi:hypothetical protein